MTALLYLPTTSISLPATEDTAAEPILLPLALLKQTLPTILRTDGEHQERSSQIVDHSGLAEV